MPLAPPRYSLPVALARLHGSVFGAPAAVGRYGEFDVQYKLFVDAVAANTGGAARVDARISSRRIAPTLKRH
jgi:hypothetical protein